MKTLYRLRFAGLLLLLLAVVPGCYTVRYAVPPEHAASEYDIVDSFEVQKKASWVIFGLVPINEAEVEEIVAREIRRLEADAATNIVVEAQYDAVDVVVAAILGGLFNTRTYTVSGDVVRFRNFRADAQTAPEQIILGEVRYQTPRQP